MHLHSSYAGNASKVPEVHKVMQCFINSRFVNRSGYVFPNVMNNV